MLCCFRIQPYSVLLRLAGEPVCQCLQSRQTLLAQPVEFSHFWPKRPLDRRRSVQRNELLLNSGEDPAHINRIRRVPLERNVNLVVASFSVAFDANVQSQWLEINRNAVPRCAFVLASMCGERLLLDPSQLKAIARLIAIHDLDGNERLSRILLQFVGYCHKSGQDCCIAGRWRAEACVCWHLDLQSYSWFDHLGLRTLRPPLPLREARPHLAEVERPRSCLKGELRELVGELVGIALGNGCCQLDCSPLPTAVLPGARCTTWQRSRRALRVLFSSAKSPASLLSRHPEHDAGELHSRLQRDERRVAPAPGQAGGGGTVDLDRLIPGRQPAKRPASVPSSRGPAPAGFEAQHDLVETHALVAGYEAPGDRA